MEVKGRWEIFLANNFIDWLVWYPGKPGRTAWNDVTQKVGLACAKLIIQNVPIEAKLACRHARTPTQVEVIGV